MSRPENCFTDIEAEFGDDVMILPFNDSLRDIAEWSSSLAESEKVLISNPSLYLGGASFAIYEVDQFRFLPSSKTQVLSRNN